MLHAAADVCGKLCELTEEEKWSGYLGRTGLLHVDRPRAGRAEENAGSAEPSLVWRAGRVSVVGTKVVSGGAGQLAQIPVLSLTSHLTLDE